MPPGNNSYEEFLRNVTPQALGLAACSANLNRSAYSRLQGKRKKDENDEVRKLSADYKLTKVGDVFFDVTGTFKLTIRDKTSNTSVLTIECTFQSHFHGTAPISEEWAR